MRCQTSLGRAAQRLGSPSIPEPTDLLSNVELTVLRQFWGRCNTLVVHPIAPPPLCGPVYAAIEIGRQELAYCNLLKKSTGYPAAPRLLAVGCSAACHPLTFFFAEPCTSGEWQLAEAAAVVCDAQLSTPVLPPPLLRALKPPLPQPCSPCLCAPLQLYQLLPPLPSILPAHQS